MMKIPVKRVELFLQNTNHISLYFDMRNKEDSKSYTNLISAMLARGIYQNDGRFNFAASTYINMSAMAYMYEVENESREVFDGWDFAYQYDSDGVPLPEYQSSSSVGGV